MSQAPRYDSRIKRKGGYQWASETDLEGLQFWYSMKAAGTSKPEYAEKDREEARKLSYWVKYREADPYSRWKGVRGDGEVVALQPSNKPVVHSWDEKPAHKVEYAELPPNVDPKTGEVREPGDDDDIPF